MNRKISVGMAVTIVILAMTVTFSITMLIAMRLFDSTVSSVKEKESMYNKVAEVDRYVRSNDYYPIDETVLYDRLTAGYLLGTGDKYARYYSAIAYTELMNQQSGKVMGIGVELGIDQTGYAKVTKVYEDSPAQEAGIVAGDYITAIDGTEVKSLSGVDAVQARLQGEAGTTVNVTWLNSEAASKTADLTHSGYTSTTVDYQMLDSVGYIRIRQFDGSTPSELDYAIRSLTASGAQSFVFDLRDNGGGVLDDAVSCIDLIAPEGTVAYAEDKNGNRTIIGSSDNESRVDLPIVCLVNGNTASAAELFAASLHTMNGARLVGTTTMGKGTIQSSPQRLSDGSAVSITVAKLICGVEVADPLLGHCRVGKVGLVQRVELGLAVGNALDLRVQAGKRDARVQQHKAGINVLDLLLHHAQSLGHVAREPLNIVLVCKPGIHFVHFTTPKSVKGIKHSSTLPRISRSSMQPT